MLPITHCAKTFPFIFKLFILVEGNKFFKLLHICHCDIL